MQELLIDGLVTASAISGRQFRRNHKAVMVLLFLSCRRLVAVQTVHTFAGVGAHLVFVHDGILRTRVTLGAFSGGAHEFGAGLLGLDLGPCTINQESGENQREGNDDRQEDGSKRHFEFFLWRARSDLGAWNSAGDIVMVWRQEASEI